MNIEKYHIHEGFGWLYIFKNILKHVVINKMLLILILILLDIIIFFFFKKVMLLGSIVLLYAMMATNHEYGHYRMVKKLKISNHPVKLAIMKKRYYITYTIDIQNNIEDAILLVRFNAIFYDILSIIIGVILYLFSTMKFLSSFFIVIAILNLGNYFILLEGSDGFIIRQYANTKGVNKLFKLIIKNICCKWSV